MARRLRSLARAVRIVDQVQDALMDAILSGSLKAGEQLSVPELARRLNVSRSPVREATLALVAKGLAVEQPRRGVVVATIEPDDLLAIHEVREFLEAGAARLAAKRIDADGVDRLRKVLAEQKAAVRAGEASGYFRTNSELHRLIWRHSGNPRLEEIGRTLENQMRLALHRIAADSRHMRTGYDEHAEIIEAIAAGDATGAERAMRKHIANTSARIQDSRKADK